MAKAFAQHRLCTTSSEMDCVYFYTVAIFHFLVFVLSSYARNVEKAAYPEKTALTSASP